MRAPLVLHRLHLMRPSRPAAPRRLEELVVEALVACLDEMEAVSSALLAVLLQCFLDTVSGERAREERRGDGGGVVVVGSCTSFRFPRRPQASNPRAAEAAALVLQRCGDKLVVPVALAVNHWLAAAAEDDEVCWM